jgi:hypothetical protein
MWEIFFHRDKNKGLNMQKVLAFRGRLILVPVFQKKIKLPLHFQSILIKVPGLTF